MPVSGESQQVSAPKRRLQPSCLADRPAPSAQALEIYKITGHHRLVNNGVAGARQRGAGAARPPVLLQLDQAAGSRTTMWPRRSRYPALAENQ
jgi:hypothetical protein